MIANILQVADTSNGLHENKFVAIIIVVVILGFAIWKAWPALMENNVFSKQKRYDYGRGEELLDSKKSNTNHLLTGMFILGLFGLVLLIWHYLQPVDYTENNNKEFKPYGFFFLSLLGAIGLLIYTVLDEAVFTIHNLKYALKVWITTMLVSPIALLIMDRKRIINVKWLLSLYQYTTLIGYGISMVSFAIFVYTVHRITVRFPKTITRRLYILLITEAALLSTCL